MGRKHQLFALALAIVLIISACGANPSTPSAVSSAISEEETAVESAVESVAAPAAENVEDPAEAQSDVVESAEEIAAGPQITYPISDEVITLSFWGAYTADIPTYYTIYDHPTMAALDEATGVHLDCIEVSRENIINSFNIMAASGDYADILSGAGDLYSGGVAKALEDGVILDLSNLIEENAPDYIVAVQEYGLEKFLTTEGKYLQISGIYDATMETFGYFMRQDWLDALQMDVPTTYDEFYEVLCAFKDEFGCNNSYLMCETFQDSEHMPNGFGTPGFCASPFNAISYLFVDNGIVMDSFNQDGYKKYLQEMNKWYEAGLFTSDFVSVSSRPNDNGRMELIASGDTGMFYAGTTSIDSCSQAIDPDRDNILVPIADPVESEGMITHFNDSTNVAMGRNLCLSSSCSNPEAALQWCNYTFTDEGYQLFNYGIEGDAYTMEDGKVVWDMDKMVNNEWGLPAATAYKGYALIEIVVGLFDRYATYEFESDGAHLAVETWTNMSDNSMYLPSSISLTGEELEIFSAANADVTTYASEMIPQFIMGIVDFDSDWDEFTSNLNEMGLVSIVELYQRAYERFIA